MAVSMKLLLEAGVHFGHQTKRWNPKMKPFIFTERNGIHIIDLQQTVTGLSRAAKFVKDVVKDNQTVLFVGTKKQAQETVEEEANRCDMFFVNRRWLGGMLTNFQTIQQRIRRLEDLEQRREGGEFVRLPKKESLKLEDEIDRLNKLLGGIKGMRKLPGAVWIIDTRKEHIAIKEARRLGIPIVALLDTNCDPDEVDYGVPANDDAIRAVRLLTARIADAVIEGRAEIEAEHKDDEEDELIKQYREGYTAVPEPELDELEEGEKSALAELGVSDEELEFAPEAVEEELVTAVPSDLAPPEESAISRPRRRALRRFAEPGAAAPAEVEEEEEG